MIREDLADAKVFRTDSDWKFGSLGMIEKTIMRSVSVAELRSQLRRYLNFAKDGEEIVIRNRNLPVAKLVPFLPQEASEEELPLVASGKMRLPKSSIKVEELLKISTGRLAASEGTAVVLEDREEGL